MAPSWHQLGSKNQPKMGYPIGLGHQKWSTPSALGRQKIEKHRLKKAIQQKRGRRFTGSPLLSRKNSQRGSKLASKTEPTSKRNRYKSRSNNWCILGLIFGRISKDFGRTNRGMLAPNRIENRALRKSEKSYLELACYCEIGFIASKLEGKFDEWIIQKTKSWWESSWHGFLLDFGGFWEASW